MGGGGCLLTGVAVFGMHRPVSPNASNAPVDFCLQQRSFLICNYNHFTDETVATRLGVVYNLISLSQLAYKVCRECDEWVQGAG